MTPEAMQSIKGETDSEVYFQWILQCAKDKSGRVAEVVEQAISLLPEMHIAYTGLNFLKADGKNLHAFEYGSRSKEYYSLFYFERDLASEPYLSSRSSETKQLLIEYKTMAGERVVIIASEKMTENEPWRDIPWGHMIVVGRDLTVHDVKIV